MDNKAVRKANIEWLVQQHGGPTEFGKAIEREQVQVSQWLGNKPIGDKLARHIERKLGKPIGWLDQPQWNGADVTVHGLDALRVGESAVLYATSQPQRIDPLKVADTITALRIVLSRRRGAAPLDLENPRDAEMFAEAYAELDAMEGTEEREVAFGAVVADLVAKREEKRNAAGGTGEANQQAGGADRTATGKARAG